MAYDIHLSSKRTFLVSFAFGYDPRRGTACDPESPLDSASAHCFCYSRNTISCRAGKPLPVCVCATVSWQPKFQAVRERERESAASVTVKVTVKHVFPPSPPSTTWGSCQAQRKLGKTVENFVFRQRFPPLEYHGNILQVYWDDWWLIELCKVIEIKVNQLQWLRNCSYAAWARCDLELGKAFSMWCGESCVSLKLYTVWGSINEYAIYSGVVPGCIGNIELWELSLAVGLQCLKLSHLTKL